jgi:hypothetical protein
MESIRVVGPESIIDHEGKILHRPIMRRKGVEKEIVPKGFQREERALDERVALREIVIIPDQLPTERRKVDKEGGQTQDRDAKPVGLEISECMPNEYWSSGNVDRFMTVKLSGHEFPWEMERS